MLICVNGKKRGATFSELRISLLYRFAVFDLRFAESKNRKSKTAYRKSQKGRSSLPALNFFIGTMKRR